ncbi:MAG TPA: phosphoglucomutase/phosphomannomutase family protein [Chloroflexota bacterium]
MAEISFGTDGWRGVIAEDYTFDNVRVCAQAIANYLEESGKAGGGIVIGYDTRFASENFAAAVAEVLGANGIKVWLSQEAAPTPAISYAILDHKAAGGVMITASHNPGIWNGLKFRAEYAGAASPEIIAKVEEQIKTVRSMSGGPRREAVSDLARAGKVAYFDPRPAYFEQIGRLVDVEAIKNAGLKVVADSMYGAGAGYFSALLKGGRTTVTNIRSERNPIFPGINPEPIPPHVAASIEAVKSHGADIGLVTDGDADRIGVVDEHGTFINQLQVYSLLFLYLLEARGMRGPAVRTVTSTVMADKLGKLYGVPVYETAVGFKYVAPKMLETDALLGGEESGGFAFKGHIPERDAMVAGLFLLDLCIKLGKPLSGVVKHLYEKVGAHYYARRDFHFDPNKKTEIIRRVGEYRPAEMDMMKVAEINTTDGYKFILEDGSWLLIRFSGTEPVMRIYTETTDPARVDRMLDMGETVAGVR